MKIINKTRVNTSNRTMLITAFNAHIFALETILIELLRERAETR